MEHYLISRIDRWRGVRFISFVTEEEIVTHTHRDPLWHQANQGAF